MRKPLPVVSRSLVVAWVPIREIRITPTAVRPESERPTVPQVTPASDITSTSRSTTTATSRIHPNQPSQRGVPHVDELSVSVRLNVPPPTRVNGGGDPGTSAGCESLPSTRHCRREGCPTCACRRLVS